MPFVFVPRRRSGGKRGRAFCPAFVIAVVAGVVGATMLARAYRHDVPVLFSLLVLLFAGIVVAVRVARGND